MASNPVRSLLRQTAQEYDLLFPDGGLKVPGFLLKDLDGELQVGWRERFEKIVSNEWIVSKKIFSERPYATLVEIRDQLRLRRSRLMIGQSDYYDRVERLSQATVSIAGLKEKHDIEATLRQALGEASARSNAAKLGWALNKEEGHYSLGFDSRSEREGNVETATTLEFAADASLELVAERLREHAVDDKQRLRKTGRSIELCSFKLQIMDAMLWQYEMFGELVGLTVADISQAADQLEEHEMRLRRESCNVPALRAAWEWMLRNRKRCWDAAFRPNRRAIWQTILLDQDHSKALVQVSGPEKGKGRITAETADRYMERFESEVGAAGLADFQRSLGTIS